MKYFKDKDNNIFAYDDEQINKGYGENLIPITEEEAMLITNPPKTEDELETIRIDNINISTGDIILSKYPLYKQNNITLLLNPYTERDLEEMKMFIETARGIGNKAKEDGIQANEIDWTVLED